MTPQEAHFRGLIAPGTILLLAAQLAYPEGRYIVVATEADSLRLRSPDGSHLVLPLGTAYRLALGFAQHTRRLKSRIQYPEPPGVLAASGYHVGKSGLPTASRRLVLIEVFHASEEVLRTRRPKDDVRDWGSPDSADRLYKMANCLASFARDAQKLSPSKAVARRDWIEDLDWLRSTFSDPRYHLRPRGEGVSTQRAWPKHTFTEGTRD